MRGLYRLFYFIEIFRVFFECHRLPKVEDSDERGTFAPFSVREVRGESARGYVEVAVFPYERLELGGNERERSISYVLRDSPRHGVVVAVESGSGAVFLDYGHIHDRPFHSHRPVSYEVYVEPSHGSYWLDTTHAHPS